MAADPRHMDAAMGWDNARIMVEAMYFAPELTPRGLQIGWKNVRRLPAAIGEPGSMIGFAKYDHRGFKGQYLLMRQLKNGSNRVAE